VLATTTRLLRALTTAAGTVGREQAFRVQWSPIYRRLHDAAAGTGRRSVRMSAATVLRVLAAALQPRGINLVHPCNLGRYNSAVAADARVRLHEPAGPAALAVICGAGRECWQPFLAHCSEHAGWTQRDDPFHNFMELAVRHAVAEVVRQHPR